MFSLATGGVAYLNAYLRANGIDPKEVSLVPLGVGAPPVEALRQGRVDGLLYWGSAMASFENTGLKLRKLKGDDWETYPDYSVAAMQSTIDNKPDLVIGIARGMAKAMVFAAANPDCARRIFWKNHPGERANAGDEATSIKWDLNVQQAHIYAQQAALKANGGTRFGITDPKGYDRLSNFMVDAKQIDKPVPASSILVEPELAKKIGDFDSAAIVASAQACSM